MKSLKEPLSLLSSTAFTPVAKLAAGRSMIHIAADRPRTTGSRRFPADLAVAAWAPSAHSTFGARNCKLLPPDVAATTSTSRSASSVRIRGAERHNAGSDRVLARHTPCRLHVPALLVRKRRKRHFAGVIHCCILVTTSL